MKPSEIEEKVTDWAAWILFVIALVVLGCVWTNLSGCSAVSKPPQQTPPNPWLATPETPPASAPDLSSLKHEFEPPVQKTPAKDAKLQALCRDALVLQKSYQEHAAQEKDPTVKALYQKKLVNSVAPLVKRCHDAEVIQ